jgi:small subunit ribosomal protein S13
MIYVLKTELTKSKSVFFALLSIYGIGRARSLLICRKLGFSSNFKVKNMSDEQLVNLLELVDDLALNVALAKDLKNLVKQDENNLVLINSYRGIRLKKGLPVRGQRTHSNAQTAGRYIVDKYKKKNKFSKKRVKSNK